MAQFLVVDGPSSSKINAQFVNKWGCNDCGNYAIPGLYYVMAASINIILSMLPLACLLLLYLCYGHK